MGRVYDVARSLSFFSLFCLLLLFCCSCLFGLGIFVCFVSLGITLFGWVIGLVWLFRGKVSFVRALTHDLSHPPEC